MSGKVRPYSHWQEVTGKEIIAGRAGLAARRSRGNMKTPSVGGNGGSVGGIEYRRNWPISKSGAKPASIGWRGVLTREGIRIWSSKPEPDELPKISGAEIFDETSHRVLVRLKLGGTIIAPLIRGASVLWKAHRISLSLHPRVAVQSLLQKAEVMRKGLRLARPQKAKNEHLPHS